MKKATILFPAWFLLALAFSLSGCEDKFTERRTYMANVPQYMSYDELRSGITATSPTSIFVLGKIYYKDQYLFVNEKYKGIHVFDNSNPANPIPIKFIDIPGNVDISIKGNLLYADSYIDLVVVDISNINNPVQAYRLEDVFPYTIPEVDNEYPVAPIDQTKGVITGWSLEEYTEEYSGEILPPPIYYFDKAGGVWYSQVAAESGGFVTSTVGIGGSLARFIIYRNAMYSINQWQMQVLDLSLPDKPVLASKFDLMRNAETVFVDSTILYIGTQTGMLMYDLKQPAYPSYIGAYDHFQSCDPVVVQEGIAYITMRAGNRCGNWQNVLETINVREIRNPVLIKTYPMTEPYGLGIDHKTLFVCDGPSGLKIYDARDPASISDHLIKQYPGIVAKDVIPVNGLLILVADDGIYQYNYSNPEDIQFLSKIDIAPTLKK